MRHHPRPNFIRSGMKSGKGMAGAFSSTSESSDGLTLLELVAVVSVISILAGMSIPRIGEIVTSSQIDEAKALLNTAAADCLQKSRLNDEDKDRIDDAIISDTQVNTIGFKIDKNNNSDKCSYFQLIPKDENDGIRFPIGFSVSDGALSKFATPTSTNQGSISSCERWAGVNCKQDEGLKRLINWKKDITANKASCEDDYTSWLTVRNTTPYKFQRWNPNAEKGCPSRPPRDGSETYQSDPTCTPTGCNKVVYGLDGEFVGFTKESYDQALESKYGKLCTEWVAKQEQELVTNSTTNPLPLTKTPECGSQEFWFFEGEDQGTKEKFMEAACNSWIDGKAKQNPPYTNNPSNQAATTPVCGDQKFWFFNGIDRKSSAGLQSAKCDATHEEWRLLGINKKYTAIGGPGNCAKEIYICNKSIVEDSTYYETEGCGFPTKMCGSYFGFKYPECKEHELSDYMIQKCGMRPLPHGHKGGEPFGVKGACSKIGSGRPGTNIDGWDSSSDCSRWAQCMGYYYDGEYF